MKTIITAILIILTLSIISCEKSRKKVVLNVNGKKHEFQFQKSTSSDIIELLGKGNHETEFIELPGDKESKGTVDERLYYKHLATLTDVHIRQTFFCLL
ncbi:MAG: hypothetical protein H0W61_01240 [Bacteroidetes bacterium]|nr:hypothetical protein [Bacteroidota bacterium]